MALGYLVDPTIQVNDINGKPVANGKIYVYDADTSNLAVTYKDFEGHANTNPVLTDELGNCTIIADSSLLYDVVVNDENDELLFSKKGLSPFGSISGGSSHTVVSAGEGIVVSVRSAPGATIYDVSIDDSIVPTFDDLSTYQTQLTGGKNINISSNKINLNDTVILSGNNASATFTKNSIKIKQGTGTTNIGHTGASFVDSNGSNIIETTGISIGTYPYANDITYFENKIGDYSTNTGRNQTTIQNSYGFFLNDYDNITEYGSTISATSADIVLVEKDSNGTSSYSLKDACTGTHGAIYSAGPNIDITSNVISGRDWSPELAEKLDATAFHPSDSMQAGTDLVITPLNVIKVDTNGFTSGSQNFVMNHNTSAIGNYNLVGGLNSSAVGVVNLVFGTSNKLSGNESVVVGKNNTVNNIDCSFVVGSSNTVSGDNNFVEGTNNNVVAVQSTIHGVGNTVDAGSFLDHWGDLDSANVNVNIIGKNNVLKNLYNNGDSEIIIGNNNINSAEITSEHNAYCNTLIGKNNKIIRSTSNVSYSNQVFGEGNTLSGDRFVENTIAGYNNKLSSTNGIYYSTLLGVDNIIHGRVEYFQLMGYNNIMSGNRVFENVLIGTQNEIKNDNTGNDLDYATVVGHRNILTSPASANLVGYDNTLIGYGNKVTAFTNAAIGINNTIDGRYAVAFGYANKIYQAKSSTGSDELYNNMAFGEMNQVSGERCSCLGIQNSARGIRTICYGDGNYGFGSYQELHGFDNKISGNYNTVMGFDNSANTLFYCNVIGSGNNLPNYNSGCTFVGDNNNIDRGHDHFVIGSYNDFDYDSQKMRVLGSNNVVDAEEVSIIGDNNTASSGLGGFIIGYSNYTNKTRHPFIMGSANSAYSGSWFKVIGENNVMSGGEDMHAIGYRNENRGYNNTFFIGHGLKATKNDSYYVGCWNAGKNSNTVFEIGYGSSNSNRKTLFLIDINGNVSAAGSITTGVTMTANS